MIDKASRSIAEIFADDEVMNAAIAGGVWDALRSHSLANRAVAMSKNGRIVWRPAAELLAERAEQAADSQ